MEGTLEPTVLSNAITLWEGVAYFSWPATIVGKRIKLNWELMPVEQYNSFQTMWEADASLVFTPNGGSAFNVMIMNLTSTYFLNLNSANSFRKSVILDLLILSAV
jgi:hypothetical protein